MNSQMSQGLRFPFQRQAALAAAPLDPPGIPAGTVSISVKMRGPGTRHGCGSLNILTKFSVLKGPCMRLALERAVPQEEHRKAALGSLTDWEAARIFLEVARRGSVRSAAERLNLSINFVRRRVGDFERQIGAALLTLGGRIIPLEVELRGPFDIWLSYHPGSGRIPRVRHDRLAGGGLQSRKIPVVYGRIRPSKRISGIQG
jgi:hypothetical protein